MSIRQSPIPKTTLRKLEALAERALFGTLSESYRTCGQPRCHCHQGQKHGPHLYVSFRGPEGKTTGYYVPQELAGAVREGIAAWQELQAQLRDLAEENNIAYKVDIYPYYGSDGEAYWRAGGDVAVALIGPGVDASHNYERTHIEALTATTQWVVAYLLS